MTYTLILSCEHAVNHVPDALAPLFKPHHPLLNTHAGYDIGALEVATALSEALNAPLFQASVSRLVIDCNRSLYQTTVFSLLTKSLSLTEKQQLIETYYQPYRNAVLDMIQSHAPVLHLSIHSFTPILNEVARNAEIGLLYDPRRPDERDLAIEWQKKLAHSTMRIRRNYPYLGKADGFTSFLRKQFQVDAYLGFEIELNQAVLTDASLQALVIERLIQTLPKNPSNPYNGSSIIEPCIAKSP